MTGVTFSLNDLGTHRSVSTIVCAGQRAFLDGTRKMILKANGLEFFSRVAGAETGVRSLALNLAGNANLIGTTHGIKKRENIDRSMVQI